MYQLFYTYFLGFDIDFTIFKMILLFRNKIITHLKLRLLNVSDFYQIFLYMLMINLRCGMRGDFYFRLSRKIKFRFAPNEKELNI